MRPFLYLPFGSYVLFCWIERTRPVPGSTETVAVATPLLSFGGTFVLTAFQAAFITLGSIAVRMVRPPRLRLFSRSCGVSPRARAKALLLISCSRTYSQ